MSRTLFWYLFKDLLRVFFLASFALAGIMSFGGLLRPLTQHGLDGSQVGRMLLYLMPAMTTYSLPIAALFATTIVYGRLSADHELTACRAAGISHLSIATPAMVLGLAVSIISLLFLCFIVPAFTLKVEQVVKSNIARLLQHQIERTHRLALGRNKSKIVVFAQGADVSADPEQPDEQCVTLVGPTIIEERKTGEGLGIPRQFHMARQATIYIRQLPESGQVSAEIALAGGTTFPREMRGRIQAGIESVWVGPLLFDSPIHENTKFMDIVRLKTMYRSPLRSQRIRRLVDDYAREEQIARFAGLVLQGLQGPDRRCTFQTGTEAFELSATGPAKVELYDAEELRLTCASPAKLGLTRRSAAGTPNLVVDAPEVRLRLIPDNASGRMVVVAAIHHALNRLDPTSIPADPLPQRFSVPMPEEIRQIPAQRTPDYYRSGPGSALLSAGQLNELSRELLKITNQIAGEMHARVSFAISCLILVLVGCALGMMFRSGNFLSAFALSVLPALLGIALIGAGQQMVDSLPGNVLKSGFANPLQFGLGLIWSGNSAVSAIAAVLLWRLQRQ